MKLALVRRHFSAVGGAELYLQRLLGALVARGHELHLLTESWSEAPAGVTLHRIPNAGSRNRRSAGFAAAVQAELRGMRFDCVFSLERTRQQDVYRAGDGVHGVWLERRRQFAPWWRKPFIGRGAFHRHLLALEAQVFDPQNTRRIIVNSEMVRQEILRHFPFPSGRIHLVRNGVDTARFRSGQRAETRSRLGVRDGEFLLLFAGSGWERKGLAFVMQAFGRLKRGHPQIKLLVAGKGRAPQLPPRDVIFAGPMADLENAYAAADLMVFPPVYEPSANVVIEALVAGLPVVTSPYNGAAEVIQENLTGNVVNNFWQPEALADAVEPWLAAPRRIQVDLAAFSLERNVIETLAVLDLAAGERPR